LVECYDGLATVDQPHIGSSIYQETSFTPEPLYFPSVVRAFSSYCWVVAVLLHSSISISSSHPDCGNFLLWPNSMHSYYLLGLNFLRTLHQVHPGLILPLYMSHFLMSDMTLSVAFCVPPYNAFSLTT